MFLPLAETWSEVDIFILFLVKLIRACFLVDLLAKDLKLFRTLVRLRGLTAIFWDMTRFINKHQLIILVGRILL